MYKIESRPIKIDRYKAAAKCPKPRHSLEFPLGKVEGGGKVKK